MYLSFVLSLSIFTAMSGECEKRQKSVRGKALRSHHVLHPFVHFKSVCAMFNVLPISVQHLNVDGTIDEWAFFVCCMCIYIFIDGMMNDEIYSRNILF